jgi:[ribosomal protein S5]-alanine N-acetyltransferase
MKLYTPSKIEARSLLASPEKFIGLVICDGSLPPSFLFEFAMTDEAEAWIMPRLFCADNLGRIVGSGGFKSAPNGRKIEIGYGVAIDCRNKGYATAGVSLLVEQAFLSGCIDEVLAEVNPGNLASRKVLEKSGFEYYGDDNTDDEPVMKWRKKK